MAVYTPLDSAQISKFLAEFEFGQYVRHEGITQGVENSNFHLWTTEGRYILTVFEKRIDPNDLPFVFAFVEHLGEAGIPVAPVLGQGHIAGKSAAIITYLEGRDVPGPQLSVDHCLQAGAMLAQMHRAAEYFNGSRANPVGLQQWRQMYGVVRTTLAPELVAVADQVLKEYRPNNRLPRGVVHADYFPDNVFFSMSGGISGVIDFYFAGTDAYVYDAAMAVNAWCFTDTGVIIPERLHAFAHGYETVRPMEHDERSAFDAQRRAAALRIFLTRQYDWHNTPAGANVVKKDPGEYAAKLMTTCHWPQ